MPTYSLTLRSQQNQKLTIQQLDENFLYITDLVQQIGLTGATGPVGATGPAGSTGSVGSTGSSIVSGSYSNGNIIFSDSQGSTFSVGPFGLAGTNNFEFIFLDSGVTYSATFSFDGGILMTYSTPYVL